MSLGLLLTLAVQVVGSIEEVGTALHQLRTTDPMVSEVIRDGRRQSPTFASLVGTLEQSDTFVYVVRVQTLPHRMEGCLVHDGIGSGRRYLRVLLKMGTPQDWMIVVLAHELQHVREVLDSGIANDQRAMDALFKRIGNRQLGSDTGEQYETAAAQRVATAVARELGASRHRGREPS